MHILEGTSMFEGVVVVFGLLDSAYGNDLSLFLSLSALLIFSS